MEKEPILCYIPACTRVWDKEGNLVSEDTYLYPIRSKTPESLVETLMQGAKALGVSLDELAFDIHKEKFLGDPQNQAEFEKMNAHRIEMTLAGKITWKHKPQN